MKKLSLLICLITVLASSCSKYNRLLKSTDFDEKYKAAINYYEKKSYVKAMPLLEELLTIYRGSAKGEKIYYYYAKSNYELGDYILAAYHFKVFARTYPNSQYAEECLYMNAYCFYLNSPVYRLDQSFTKDAIEQFQVFINQYPESSRREECNTTIDKLRGKLALKAFENAKLYYHIENYKSAIVAFNNCIKDFPSSGYKEECMYLILKSYYLLAEQSIDAKKPERYQLAIDNYAKFAETFPKSRRLKDAEGIVEKCRNKKEKLINKKTS